MLLALLHENNIRIKIDVFIIKVFWHVLYANLLALYLILSTRKNIHHTME